MKDMKDDFGFVPMPKGPHAKGYSNWVDHNASVVSVPINVNDDDLEDIGIILEAEAFAAKDEFDMQLEDFEFNYYRDDEGVKMARLISENLAFDPLFMLRNATEGLNDGTTNVIDACRTNEEFDYAAQITEQEEIIKTSLEELVIKLQEK